jgi:hypothetical protein
VTFNKLYGVLTQKKQLFITTAPRASNPAFLISVGFEVLAALTMRSAVFWVVTLRNTGELIAPILRVKK